MKRILVIYSAMLVVSLALSYFLYLLKPVGSSTNLAGFIVRSGQGLDEIAVSLKTEGWIRSGLIFKIYSLVSGSASRLKPGHYDLSTSLSVPEIITMLVQGPDVDVTITIVEGEDWKAIADKLERNGVVTAKDFLNYQWRSLTTDFPFLQSAKSLEGFLFPDTYRFFLDSSPEAVAKKFLDNFGKKARPLLKNWDGAKTGLDSYGLLILASLIEKEVPFSEDRVLVSGILRARLAIDMALQVDAAPETYKRYGLPSSPIANPGLDAIYAAIHPRSSNYFYYLSDPRTKKTIFSRTLEEHNENRAKYLGR